MKKAYGGDLIRITKAFDEPYSVGDILEVDLRQSDMGACDDNVLMTTEGYIVNDGDYEIFKAAVRVVGQYTDKQVADIMKLLKTSDPLRSEGIASVCNILGIKID